MFSIKFCISYSNLFFKGVGMVPRKAARLENWKSWIKIFRKSGKCRKQLFLQEVDQDLREWNKICEVLILALWLFDLWSHPKREGVLISKWEEGGEILQNKLSGGRNKRGVYIFIYLRLKNNIHLFIVEYKQIAKKNFYINNKLRLYPRRHVHCFNWKRAFRPFTVYSGAILVRVDFGSQKTN